MACYHPLKAFPIGKTLNGKVAYHIAPYTTKYIYQAVTGEWKRVFFDHDTFVERHSKDACVTDFIEIPCGHCIGCRLDYSKMWADRCMLELQHHGCNWYVTLTYDDDHLPRREYLDTDSGEVRESCSLMKRDVQLFNKRLRKALAAEGSDSSRMRYYVAGEYGEISGRPHYHGIYYDLPLNDLVFYKRNRQGDFLYISPWLTKIWKNGNVVVGEVTYDSCAYTARYITKKLNGPAAKIYSDLNIDREFTVMSLRPTIGREWFDKHGRDFIDFDYISVPTDSGGRKVSSCRYFDRLLEAQYPSEMSALKDKRMQAALSRQKLLHEQTSQSYLDMLASEEYNKIMSTKVLKRGGVI